MALARTSKPDRPTALGRRPTRKAGYAKVTVTLPRELAEAARRRVESGEAASMSALVTKALGEMLEEDSLEKLLADMEAKYGPVAEEDREWARQVFDRIPPTPVK